MCMKPHKKVIDNEPAPFITGREFNRLVAKRGTIVSPWEDSKGDSAEDEIFEVTMGEDYSEDENPENTDDPIIADASSTENEQSGSEEQLSDETGVRSSDRPDHIKDIDSETSTH